MTTEPTKPTPTGDLVGWDIEGQPMFARDDLDARWSQLLDRLRQADSSAWFDIDRGVNALLDSDPELLTHAAELAELVTLLAEREHGRHRVVDEALFGGEG